MTSETAWRPTRCRLPATLATGFVLPQFVFFFLQLLFALPRPFRLRVLANAHSARPAICGTLVSEIKNLQKTSCIFSALADLLALRDLPIASWTGPACTVLAFSRWFLFIFDVSGVTGRKHDKDAENLSQRLVVFMSLLCALRNRKGSTGGDFCCCLHVVYLHSR